MNRMAKLVCSISCPTCGAVTGQNCCLDAEYRRQHPDHFCHLARWRARPVARVKGVTRRFEEEKEGDSTQ